MIPLDRLAVEANLVVDPWAAMRDVVSGIADADALTTLVLDERRTVGIVTQRDIAGDVDRHDCSVAQVMKARWSRCRPTCHVMRPTT